jgi:Cu-Zn family superoxide dismutase
MSSIVARLTVLVIATTTPALAQTLTARMALATPTGPGAVVGLITVNESPGGAVFALDLKGLPPGPHGFHVHANPSCAVGEKDGKPVPAGAAGAHLDPAMSGAHMGPAGMGHLGDLPLILIAPNGAARTIVTAPRIKSLDALRGRALIIHSGGDNYADAPTPLGGGGARLACGVIAG